MHSRKIKYRVWNMSFKKWEQKVCPREDGRPIDIDGHCWQCMESVQDDIVFQFFTELKDKNNKDIYEGDILIAPDGVERTIEYNEDRGGYVAFNAFCRAYQSKNLDCDFACEAEVVGNTFENSVTT